MPRKLFELKKMPLLKCLTISEEDLNNEVPMSGYPSNVNTGRESVSVSSQNRRINIVHRSHYFARWLSRMAARGRCRSLLKELPRLSTSRRGGGTVISGGICNGKVNAAEAISVVRQRVRVVSSWSSHNDPIVVLATGGNVCGTCRTYRTAT